MIVKVIQKQKLGVVISTIITKLHAENVYFALYL